MGPSEMEVVNMKTLEVLDLVLKGKRLRPKSVSSYRRAFELLASFSEDWPESGVVINEWVGSLSNMSDGTVRLYFCLVNSAGRYVKKVMGKNKDGSYRVPNPCEDAERPKVGKKRRRYFSIKEMVDIVRACSDEYELLLVLTLVDSACRVGELVGLKGRDVGDGFINVMGKTGQRRYRLDIRICEKLRALAGGENEPVFKNKSGGFHRIGDSLGLRVRRIIERAGVTGVKLGPHTLRHSAASLLANETKQVLLVKALLQHDDIATSMQYIHDAEDLVIDNEAYSPFGILRKRVGGGESQGFLELPSGEVGESVAVVPSAKSVISDADNAELVADMFPEIKGGVAVRVVLRDDDLSLMREAFIFYALYHRDGKAGKTSALMRRMLRKGGSERYSKR
jgi:integrase